MSLFYRKHYRLEYSHYTKGRSVYKIVEFKAKRFGNGFLLYKDHGFLRLVDEESGSKVNIGNFKNRKYLKLKLDKRMKNIIETRNSSWYKKQVSYFKKELGEYKAKGGVR